MYFGCLHFSYFLADYLKPVEELVVFVDQLRILNSNIIACYSNDPF